MKFRRKRKFNIRKAAESWNYGSVAAYKEAQISGQLALYVLSDMRKENKDE